LLSFIWTTLVGLLAIPLSGLVRAWRRWQLGRRGVLTLTLSHDAPGRTKLDALASTVTLLRSMARDDLLRAVVIRARHPALGSAAVQELHGAVLELREAGKLVLVHLEQAGNQELALASAADRVFLTPAAEVMLTGVGAQLVFYGDLLERVGVTADLEAAGAYKSFGEPFRRAWPSTANREAVSALVDDLDAQLVDLLAQSRRVPPGRVVDLMQRAPVSAEDARDAGLVDALAYGDQVHDELETLLGQRVRPLSFRRYARWLAFERALSRWGHREQRVIVVHLEGPVVHGDEPSGGSGVRMDADRVVPVLESLREDERTGAVVLYVDSPGGSALASDIIARSVRRLAERRPVVAVFGNVAASGGYYVAAGAAEIVARAGSVTGSIGVVGGKLTFGQGAALLGVHMEPVVAHDGALLFSPWRAFTDSERTRFRQMLARTYDRFLEVVARGRRRSVEEIEPYAQGRVWTGRQAQEHGLVDHLGGLQLGVERARKLAGLPPRPPVYHVRFPPPRFRILSQLLGRRAQVASPDLQGMLLVSLGAAGARLDLLRRAPGAALAVLPWVLTDSSGEL